MSSLVLYQFPGKDGLSLSPFVNKVHFAMRLKRITYSTETRLFSRPTSDTGRLPVLIHDGHKVHDSTEIIRYVEAQFPDRPLVPRDPRRAAEAHVLEEWSDESFMPLLQYRRLYDATAMKEFHAISLPKVPAAIRRAVMAVRMRKTYAKFAYIHALGEDARRAQIERSLDSINALLGDQLFFGGDDPSVADVAIGAALHISIFFQKVIEPYAQAMSRPRLKAWMERFFHAVNIDPLISRAA